MLAKRDRPEGSHAAEQEAGSTGCASDPGLDLQRNHSTGLSHARISSERRNSYLVSLPLEQLRAKTADRNPLVL